MKDSVRCGEPTTARNCRNFLQTSIFEWFFVGVDVSDARCWGSAMLRISKIRLETTKHINTSARLEVKKKLVVAMVIDNRTQAHRKAENISSRSCTLLSPFGRFCQNCRDYIACASNEITLHRAVSFTASQLNGLFSLLFFRSLHWGLQRFYGQNSCFPKIIFEGITTILFYRARGR